MVPTCPSAFGPRRPGRVTTNSRPQTPAPSRATVRTLPSSAQSPAAPEPAAARAGGHHPGRLEAAPAGAGPFAAATADADDVTAGAAARAAARLVEVDRPPVALPVEPHVLEAQPRVGERPQHVLH